MNKQTKIKTLLILALVVLLGSNSNIAQNVGIGSSSFTPDPSAVLELKSTNQGLLPPRMTTAERDDIQNPATGLVIFNTTSNCLNYRVGSNWFEVCGDCTPLPATPTAGTHSPSATEIIWNWNSVAGADGYKWHTTNNYAAATDLGNVTTVTQTGLTCNTANSIYVWAYNACGNSSVLTLIQSTTVCPFVCGTIVSDIDGNTYPTILIGLQCWFKENLKVSKNPTGIEITRYCYGGNSSNCSSYGGLYTWTTIMNGATESNMIPSGVQGICPDGWHLPSDAEWIQLEEYLGMCSGISEGCSGATGYRGTNEGHKLKSTTDWTGGVNGSNSSGFTALPAGRLLSGNFQNLGYQANFYTTTEDSDNVWTRMITAHPTYTNFIARSTDQKTTGYSVRCIKD